MGCASYGLQATRKKNVLQLALKGLGSNLAGGFFVNIFAVKKLAWGCVARFGQAFHSNPVDRGKGRFRRREVR